MSDVPDELLREILSRLPVAPLLRFRCVSKSWKSFIDSQQFIKQHLNHSRKTNSNINIFLVVQHLYSADLGSLETNMLTFKDLPHPLKTASGTTDILGSCDGLLVLRNDLDDITFLWNPSVKRFHVIPSTGTRLPCHKSVSVYGFGYDAVSDDYKFIRISHVYERGVVLNSEVKVYSLKSDSWRMISDFPCHFGCDPERQGVLANGALHFLVSRNVNLDSEYLVGAFDLGTEEYRFLPLPRFARGDCRYLAVLGGCLGLLYEDSEESVDMWVMKEYGVQGSWSILFSHDICHDIHDDISHFAAPTWTLAYSKCGRKVLQVCMDNFSVVLAWYDLYKKNFSVVPLNGLPSALIDAIATCSESLVLLNNGTCDYGLVTKQILERKMEMKIATLNAEMEMKIDTFNAEMEMKIATLKTELEMKFSTLNLQLQMKTSKLKTEMEMLIEDAIRQNESQMDTQITDADMNAGQEESHEVSKKRLKKTNKKKVTFNI